MSLTSPASPASLRGRIESFFVAESERHLVRGLAGDPQALEELLSDSYAPAVMKHRLGPALALRGKALGLALSDAWNRRLRLAIGRKMLLEHHLSAVGEALGKAEIRWLPIKGFDLGSRAYDAAEERPAGDIDIFVDPSSLARAREVLADLGWVSRAHGRRFESFLEDEGYCWQGRNKDGTELEVHFRLWGMVPTGYPATLFDAATEDPNLGSTAYRCHPADAYLLAAVHTWMDPPPRPLLSWWDLERISGLCPSDRLGEEVAGRALRWQLQLPVLLAAAHAGELWPDGPHHKIAASLRAQLRATERQVVRKALRQGTNRITLGSLTLARLLARRPSRSGVRAVWRRIWAHPGVVERETPEAWPWMARRVFYLAKREGWSRAAGWLESRFGGV